MIKVVKEVVCILVFVNGNIWWFEDVYECIRMMGVDGVMFVEFLLENFVFFGGYRMKFVEDVIGSLDELSREGVLNELLFILEYLDFCEKYFVIKKMIWVYVYKLLVGWFK